jgi:hypothetical protein
MQRLHPAVHHLREAGDRRHRHNREARLFQGAHGAARRDEFETPRDEATAELDETRFIRNAQERSRHVEMCRSL